MSDKRSNTNIEWRTSVMTVDEALVVLQSAESKVRIAAALLIQAAYEDGKSNTINSLKRIEYK